MTNETKNTNFGYWKEVLDNLPESYREWFNAERDFLRANIPRDSKILEIGCGEGRSLDYVSDLGKLFGVDNNPQSVMQARERFKDNPNVSIVLDDARKSLYRDSWFDRVLCLTTPANFGYERELFYREMRRLVKEDGEILLSVFNEDRNTRKERMKLYEKLKAPIKEVDEGTYGTVIFDYSDGAAISEQFSESDLRGIFMHNNLFPIEIKKEGLGYFCRAIK